MAKKFISERQPPSLTATEESLSAAGAGDARVFGYTRLRLLRPGIATVVIEHGMVVLYHCMDNARFVKFDGDDDYDDDDNCAHEE